MIYPAQLATKIAKQDELSLMLDYDGTLVPLTQRPELANPQPHLINLLKKIISKPGIHLAIISGRNLEDLQSLLPLKGLYFAGLHGSMIVKPGQPVINLKPDANVDIPWQEILTRAQDISSCAPGTFVENKGKAIAFHYRLADPKIAEKAQEQFKQYLNPFIIKRELELLHGNKVLEVRQRGINKGLAVKYFISLWPGAYPLYLGDDQTDEDAFAAIPDHGLTIHIGNCDCTKAKYFFNTPADVVQFLFELYYNR